MPDQRPDGPEALAERYRCTFLYADDVVPPAVPGEVAMQGWFPDRENADLCIEEGAARTDLGRLTLEQLISEPGERPEWGVLHGWERTAEGWKVV
jgi:hypothetical protein